MGRERRRQEAVRAHGPGDEELDQAKRRELIHSYLDVIAEQAVLYPVVHTELMTAWDPKKLSGIRAQAYPGISLLQARRA
ncbi:hypothetical protein [Nonomuraea recticatena]|uniref:hypothetical protein n=1 Tax=Nonomuraea recticatena TaxID=46178 RepID=UPI003620FF8F